MARLVSLLADPTARLDYRRFVMSMSCLVASFASLWLGLIDGGTLTTLVLGVTGIYFGQDWGVKSKEIEARGAAPKPPAPPEGPFTVPPELRPEPVEAPR